MISWKRQKKKSDTWNSNNLKGEKSRNQNTKKHHKKEYNITPPKSNSNLMIFFVPLCVCIWTSRLCSFFLSPSKPFRTKHKQNSQLSLETSAFTVIVATEVATTEMATTAFTIMMVTILMTIAMTPLLI